MAKNLNTYLNKTTDVSPLVIFRIGFGIMMCYGIIRFWIKGWIETIYIQPNFHFSYFGLYVQLIFAQATNEYIFC